MQEFKNGTTSQFGVFIQNHPLEKPPQNPPSTYTPATTLLQVGSVRPCFRRKVRSLSYDFFSTAFGRVRTIVRDSGPRPAPGFDSSRARLRVRLNKFACR
ncbi:hypothetical protein Zmor_024717 [Zophobas morio]|uniref:Uncharacterized protein n=1 Tax=Zophobas morio TaxID=2755281 RepID=A0AA38HZI6_9CUCU|nr:hypothetical protein Zmor_024717 [Zophobas morio]